MRVHEATILAVALAIAPAVVPITFACSSTSDTPAPPPDAGDAADETPAPPPEDAGPDIEQPPNIYPAQHAPIPQLDQLGGPVLAHPKIVTVTFYHSDPDAGATADASADGGPAGDAGGDAATPGRTPDVWRDSLRHFDDFIVTSDWWHQTMAGYGVGDGSGGLYGELDDAPVANKAITDDDIQTLLRSGIDSGALPPPDPAMIYAFYFPQSTQISNFDGAACAQFLGYHYEAQITHAGASTQVAYAVLPRCVLGATTQIEIKQQLTITASHELAEAASDPYPASSGAYRLDSNDAWVPSLGLGSAGNENGDLCIFAPAYDESGWQVQAIWSNQAAKESREPCQPQPTGADPIYFNAAVRTDKIAVDRTRNSWGYVKVPIGGSVDVIIDFFSTAKLPNDVTLFVGRDNGSPDPTSMAPIPNGITTKLSRLQAHNGNGIVMTLSAPANAVAGDFRFLVRSVLKQDDYHDWPVIARVQ